MFFYTGQYFLILLLIGILEIVLGVILIRLVLRQARKKAQKIVSEAQAAAQEIESQAEARLAAEIAKERKRLQDEFQERRQELEKLERRLRERENTLNIKDSNLSHKEFELLKQQRELITKEKVLKAKTERLDQLIAAQNERLERIANLSIEEAKKELFQNIEAQTRLEASQIIHEIREKAKREAEREAKNIILQAIQRCAISQVAETTVSVINIPSEDIKGRIIGREGRNIRTFETLTGVEVIIDDTPNAIVLSAFDPIRREIARLAMERLIADGRIHQTRIEEIVAKAKEEIENVIIETGEGTMVEFGLSGLHPELIKLIGRLKFRTSYGQNVLLHSKEVAILASNMAQELNLDPALAKRCGLLHDIGKAADIHYEGPHARIGAELAQKYGEDEVVINAIAAHHEEVVPISPYAFLTAAADAISGARAGARSDSYETYINRLRELENIAHSFAGVEKAYAIQAGREIRVMVEPEKISDLEAEELARKISRQIQQELKYPGQIKVVVIREVRAVDYAR
ncbi:MAG: ribonuclease Y [candidate division WOR-3 bacterium]|nr:ribonuclease Y [candidate division WOR-3 bacterium]